MVAMSRIGKKPISLPDGVSVEVSGHTVRIKGPKGECAIETVPACKAVVEHGALRVILEDKAAKKGPALWGLTRALLSNAVVGVTHGFSKSLEINGVGYKVALKGRALVLHVGFSHPVEYELPPGIEAKVDKNMISISGINRQMVGQVAAEIRAIRKPEPYKGKGIKYTGEVIRRKVGKVMKSAA